MSDPVVHSIPALVHGEVLVVPAAEPGPSGAPLLFGCHGYGETAHSQLDALRRIPGSERFTLAAVQALHPFYKKTGEVVRSWMTREDRERALADNIRYVGGTLAELRRVHPLDGTLVVAGFSQGVAMAWRTATRAGWPCHGLIVLAGDVPADAVDPAPLALPAILLGRGTEDTWYTEAKERADRSVLEQLDADVTTHVFEGGHEWHPDFLAAAGDFLERFAAD
ncbi:MAG: phospholipase [Acidobacteriota bacterium]